MPDAVVYEFHAKKAKREGVGLFVGLAGPSGSGKTYSALRLARGMVGPKGRILAADTEGKRMTHYDTYFDFDVVNLTPPFRPAKFEALVKYAEEEKYDVLVIDSFTHVWAGDGGVLEWHDEITGGDEKRNMMAWGKVKPPYKAMVQSFLQRTIPIIFCMRAEEKVKVLPGGKPVPMGWMPICEKNFQFELTTMITLSNEHPGLVDYKLPRKIQRHHLDLFKDGAEINEAAGAALMAWARGDDLPKAKAPPPSETATDKTTAIVDAIAARINKVDAAADVDAIFREDLVARQTAWMQDHRKDQYERLMQAADARIETLNKTTAEPPPHEEDPPPTSE